jgi:hypothetical protein
MRVACRSTSPSAFTGYAFHTVEALIVFANEIIVCFLFPMHMGLHRLYHIATTAIHEGEGLGAVSTANGSNTKYTACLLLLLLNLLELIGFHKKLSK